MGVFPALSQDRPTAFASCNGCSSNNSIGTATTTSSCNSSTGSMSFDSRNSSNDNSIKNKTTNTVFIKTCSSAVEKRLLKRGLTVPGREVKLQSKVNATALSSLSTSSRYHDPLGASSMHEMSTPAPSTRRAMRRTSIGGCVAAAEAVQRPRVARKTSISTNSSTSTIPTPPTECDWRAHLDSTHSHNSINGSLHHGQRSMRRQSISPRARTFAKISSSHGRGSARQGTIATEHRQGPFSSTSETEDSNTYMYGFHQDSVHTSPRWSGDDDFASDDTWQVDYGYENHYGSEEPNISYGCNEAQVPEATRSASPSSNRPSPKSGRTRTMQIPRRNSCLA